MNRRMIDRSARYYEYCESEAGCLGKMALIFETRSKANLHNRNTLFPLPLFTFILSLDPRSKRGSTRAVVYVRSLLKRRPLFSLRTGCIRGEEDREGFDNSAYETEG